MTNRDLLTYYQEIQRMQNSVLGYFHRSKIVQFNSDFGARLQTLNNSILKLRNEYLDFNQDGSQRFIEKKTKKHWWSKAVTEKVPAYKLGKSRENFQAEYEKLMNITVNIL